MPVASPPRDGRARGTGPAAAALCAAVVVAASTSCSVVVDNRARPDKPDCAAATSVALDPVDGGDVNTMYVKATLTGPDGPVAKATVIFYLARPGSRGRDILQAPPTDIEGVTLLDLGGHVASHDDKRDAIRRSDTLSAEYTGDRTTSPRRLCPSSRTVAFRPDVRAYHRADTGVRSAAQLVDRLRAVERVLGSDSPYRMPDGQSPCRTFAALVDDMERHSDWFDPAALRNALDDTELIVTTCVPPVLLTSVQVGRVADKLDAT